MKFRRGERSLETSQSQPVDMSNWHQYSPRAASYDLDRRYNPKEPSSDSAYELQSRGKLDGDSLQQHVTPLTVSEQGQVVGSTRGRRSQKSQSQLRGRAASVGRFLSRGVRKGSNRRRAQSVDKRQEEYVPSHQQSPTSRNSPRTRQRSAADRPDTDLTSVSYDHSEQSDENKYQVYEEKKEEDYQRNHKRESIGMSRSEDDNDEQDYHDQQQQSERKKKSKMEKIRQLQAKNELYKEEFKRVQKDRKQLKKEMENKRQEIAALSDEVDSHIAETSHLKSKLSQALQQLDRTEHENQKSKLLISQLSKELTDSQVELDRAQDRISELTEKLHSLKEQNRVQDEQMDTLTRGLTDQAQLIEKLQHEKSAETNDRAAVAANDEKLQSLQAENEKLHKELGSTLERAATMVKEREDAIADLLKENDEMKEQRENLEENKEAEEELLALREEMAEQTAALEESQDRNVVLEEEVEAWIRRGREMENDINKLLVDVAAWKQKAMEAEDEREALRETVEKTEEEKKTTDQRLEDSEERHRQELADLESKMRSMQMTAQEEKHAAKLKAQEEKEAAVEAVRKQMAAAAQTPEPIVKPTVSQDSGDVSEASSDSSVSGPANEGMDAQSQQAMLLEKALAKRKQNEKKSTWGFFAKSDEEELTEDQKKIKELEAANEDQEEEIKKLKSELVRLRSTYNETMYVSKKKIEQLETEKEQLAEKNTEMELKLEAALCV